MMRAELDELLQREPFELFCIKLENGDVHDVFDPGSVLVMSTDIVRFYPRMQNWAYFPIDKITGFENQIDDYQAKLQEYKTR